MKAKKITAFAKLQSAKGAHWHCTAPFEPNELLGWPKGVPATRFTDCENGNKETWEKLYNEIADSSGSTFAMNQRQVSLRVNGIRLQVSTAMRGAPQEASFGPVKLTPARALEIIEANK